MRESARMCRVIQKICDKHGVDLDKATQFYLRLEMPGFQPLVIKKHEPTVVSVAHYRQGEGDAVKDTELVFFTGYRNPVNPKAPHLWIPIEITQDVGGSRVLVTLNATRTGIEPGDATVQRDYASFGNQWAGQIEACDYLNAAQATTRDVQM